MAGTMHDSSSTVERSASTDLVPIDASYSLAPYAGMPWTGAAPRPELLTAGPDPLSLLRAFRRRWLLASGCGLLLGFVAMIVAWFYVPVTSDVAAFIYVKANPDILMGGPRLDPFEYNSFKQTQIQLIKGPNVLRGALREPGIAQLPIIQEQPDPVSWLESELKLAYPNDSEILRVSMTGDRPEQLVKLVNAVVDVYFKVHVWEASANRKRDKDKLQQKYEEFEGKIAQLRKHVTDIARNLGVEDRAVANQISNLTNELANLRQEQSNLSRQRTESELKVMQATTMLAVEKDPSRKQALIERQIAEDPRLIKMQEQRDAIAQAMNEEASKSAKRNSASQRLSAMLKETDEAIDKRKQDLEQKFSDSIVESKEGEWQANLDVSKHAVEKYQKLLEENAQAIEQRRKELEGIKIDSAELDQLREDIRTHEAMRSAMFQDLQRKMMEAEAPARVQPISPAETPEGISAFRKYLLVMFAGVFGFGVAALAVAFREFQARRISSSVQITDGLGMRVVGALPSVSRPGKRSPGADVQGMLIESIDGVRTNLIHCQGSESTQVVMITSALDREGKTTVASQLAASLARGGRRALLIDGDLRRPAAHRLFELPLEPGLCEVLRGEADVDDVIRPTRAAGLWMIPAGQYDLESIQALSKDGLADVFETLRQKFEFIVVDSAPVLTIADSLMLGQHVDAVILSVVRDVSQAPKVYDACERLRAVGMRILGCVVNGERSAATYRAYAVR